MASLPKVEMLTNVAEVQGDLMVDDPSRPRPPTPFQEIPGSSHEGSVNDNAELGRTSPPRDGVKVEELTEPGCEEGQHEYKTKHGIMGILMAMALFPCGLICFFRDKEKICTKCGARAIAKAIP